MCGEAQCAHYKAWIVVEMWCMQLNLTIDRSMDVYYFMLSNLFFLPFKLLTVEDKG